MVRRATGWTARGERGASHATKAGEVRLRRTVEHDGRHSGGVDSAGGLREGTAGEVPDGMEQEAFWAFAIADGNSAYDGRVVTLIVFNEEPKGEEGFFVFILIPLRDATKLPRVGSELGVVPRLESPEVAKRDGWFALAGQPFVVHEELQLYPPVGNGTFPELGRHEVGLAPVARR